VRAGFRPARRVKSHATFRASKREIPFSPFPMNAPENSEILIQTHALSRLYPTGGGQVAALDGVELDVGRGEFVALVGPSGSGKSTLLNLLGGLDRPTSGTVRVGEIELSGAKEAELVRYRRERVGFVFQSFNLLPMRSAVENVEMPLVLAGAGRSERRKRALSLLDSVRLGARANHKPGEMSGGEMQRVAVARALANSPMLVLADEPTGNLDTQTGQGILDILREAVADKGVTLVLVTHDLRVASYADRVVHMLDGHIERIEFPSQTNGQNTMREPSTSFSAQGDGQTR